LLITVYECAVVLLTLNMMFCAKLSKDTVKRS